MALMGSLEQRLGCLKIAAQMNRRVVKDDEVMSAFDLVTYARELESYTRRGERPDGSKVPLPDES